MANKLIYIPKDDTQNYSFFYYFTLVLGFIQSRKLNFFIASYYRQLSADYEMKYFNIKSSFVYEQYYDFHFINSRKMSIT